MGFLDFNAERRRAILDATYAFRGDLVSWADAVHAALGPALDLGQGTIVGLVDLADGGLRIEHLRRDELASPVHQAVARLTAWLAPGRLREAFFNGRVLGSSSGQYAEETLSALQQRARAVGSRDAAGWCVNDGVDYGFMVISPTAAPLALPTRTRATVRRLGHHVATGLRLQRVLCSDALDDPSVEAIFDVDGGLQHAAGMARSNDALQRLRAAVLARVETGESEVLEGAEAWDGLVSGRWSLVDRFDSDGRRFVIAHRNPPGCLDPRRLTPSEEQIAMLIALGQSNKEIALDLGIAESTVANLLAGALDKLGLESRTLLPIFWRDVHGPAYPIDGTDARLLALSEKISSEELPWLTPAERAVAKGLLAGLSDKAIALTRGCSRRTVEKHTTAIYRKLGINSRLELASKLSSIHSAVPLSARR
ncbi:MAG TPA: helix-turn-helix transcriptional regulator [Polyangiaceae bacterium]|nr:helix-turn-helix transcriptional regulator [Polyangiaceae bacterium]